MDWPPQHTTQQNTGFKISDILLTDVDNSTTMRISFQHEPNMSCSICFDSILSPILKQTQLPWCYFKVSPSGYILYMGKKWKDILL